MSEDPQPPTDQQLVHAALMQFVDLGTTLLGAIATKAQSGADLAELTPQYDCIGRGLRKTALLLDHLARAPAADAAPNRVTARKRIVRDVEDAIHGKASGADAESLRAELVERLDSPDLEHDIKTRPLYDIILDICRDFGLVGSTGQFQRRTPQDIQELFARATAAPGATPPRPLRPERQPAPEPDDEDIPAPRPEPRAPPPPARTAQAPNTRATPKPAASDPAASLLHYLTRSRGT